jgi:hypothetical protein
VREGLQNANQVMAGLMEKRRLKKASDEVNALSGMISTAFASGDPQALANTLKQLTGLKGLEPETVQMMSKAQMDMGVKMQQEQRAQKVAEFIGGLPGPQAKAVASILNLDPDQKLTEATNAAKILVAETASHVEFKNLPDKLKMGVFTAATKLQIEPNALLKLAAQGDKQAQLALHNVVDSVAGAAMDNNMYDRLTLMHFGERGITLPLSVQSFGELATKFPRHAEQVIKEAQRMESESAALQKGILTEATLAAQLKMENLQPPKITQFWIDKKKLEADPGAPINSTRIMDRPLGEIRSNPERYTELDDTQRRQIEAFNGVEAVLGEIERFIPGLPKTGGAKTLMNRVKFPSERFLGIEGMGTAVGSLQFSSLFLGRTFQGAASQLSDRDVQMSAYANINDHDSQESIKQKVEIVRRLSQRFKLAMAGVDIRKMKPVFSEDEYKKAVSTFGAPSIPVPGTMRYTR